MQQDVDNSKVEYSLNNEEIVATFPKCRSVVKRLLKENNAMIEEKTKVHQEVREFLSSRISMFDIDIATSIVMACYPSLEKAEENIRRLSRLDFAYEPKKNILRNPDTVTDLDIEKARAFPIKSLVKVRMNTTTCLWHNDRHPSMHVYPDNHAYCFVCQKRADSIDFAMQMTGKIFVEAVKHLI